MFMNMAWGLLTIAPMLFSLQLPAFLDLNLFDPVKRKIAILITLVGMSLSAFLVYEYSYVFQVQGDFLTRMSEEDLQQTLLEWRPWALSLSILLLMVAIGLLLNIRNSKKKAA